MKTVKDIMTPEPAVCAPDTGLGQVARLMREHDCGELPVVESMESRKLVGVITDRDIVTRALAQDKNPLDLTARDCMTSPAFSVTQETAVSQLCSLLEEKQVRRAPVVDADKKVIAIVSQADVALKTSPQWTAEVVRQVSAHA